MAKHPDACRCTDFAGAGYQVLNYESIRNFRVTLLKNHLNDHCMNAHLPNNVKAGTSPAGDIESLDSKSLVRDEQVTWQDLCYLRQNEWALRHVSNLQNAQREMTQGIEKGDAVSLACPQSLLVKTSELPAIFTMLPISSIALGLIPADLQISIRLLFADSVKEFIEESIKRDINNFASDRISVAETIKILDLQRSGVTVGIFRSARHPYDTSHYFGLGKCGVQQVAPEQLIEILVVKGLAEELVSGDFSPEKQSGLLDKTYHQLIARACAEQIWRKLLVTIKGQREIDLPEV